MPPVINIGLRVFGAVATLVLIFWLIGLLLPHGYQTSAEVVIEAPADKVFAFLNRLDRWPQWSQWGAEKDSLVKVEYGPQLEGVGAVQTWQEPRGRGKLWITASQPDRLLEYVVEFGDFPKMTSRIELQPIEAGTRVTWSSAGQLPAGAFYGWFRIAFVNGLRAQYQQALRKLDAVVTGKPLPEAAEQAPVGKAEQPATIPASDPGAAKTPDGK